MPSERGTIQQLVDAFARDIRHLTDPSTKEATLRLHYLDPLFRLLGWRVGDAGPLADSEVIVEPSIDVVEGPRLRSRRPDYLFKIDFPRFTCEAKKPSIDLDDDRDAIFQTKRDAWNLQIPFAILTDFQQFRVYETTRIPVHAEPRTGLVNDLRLDFSDYPTQWDVLVDTFGRDAVAGGSLEHLRARIRRTPAGRRLRTVDRMLVDLRGDQPVNEVFLSYLEKHRQHLASAIYRDNRAEFPDADTHHGAARLTEAVQRVLDRLVFIRVCEDRDVIPWGGLRELLDRVSGEHGELYQSLCARFQEFNQTFNGYLYRPHFSETLNIDGSVLADFIRTLYPPDAPWNFATMGDNLLATVYERFLGNIVTVEHSHVEVVEKPEVRHAGGVYYTPRFVVDSILRRVVKPNLVDKSPVELLGVKILDPACGSGSFLVVAFQLLINHCRQAITADASLALAILPGLRRPRTIGFQDRDGAWQLTPEFRALLLTQCIHGVDIDQQAVEVTIMSLYLKMLEVPLPANWQADLLGGNRLLPPLDNNIRCGNTLINQDKLDEYATERHGGLFVGDDDVRFRVNAFDFRSETRGFGRVLRAGRTGFNCIIGNPPYIRVQELVQWAPEECEFYKWAYDSAQRGNYDIYVVFVERCLKLLASDGLLGFIMPHKWWQAQYGAGLRRIVSQGKHLVSVLDFAEHQVFEGATTYTAIHTLSAAAVSEPVDYVRVLDLDDGPALCAAIDAGVPDPRFLRFPCPQPGEDRWSFLPDGSLIQLVRARGGTKPLSEVARLAQGFKTGADKVFVVRFVGNAGDLATIHSTQTGRNHQVEAECLKVLVKSEHMKRYELAPSELRLIFPYEIDDERASLIDPDEIEARWPRLFKGYLKPLREVLAEREHGRWDGPKFYQYSRQQNFVALSKRKIINPDISERPQFALDDDGSRVFSGGAAGGVATVPIDQSHALLLTGLLNSRFMEQILRETGTVFRGGYLNCEIRFIRDLPIKLPSTAAEHTLVERIEDSVKKVMAARTKLRRPNLSDREREQQEQAAEAADKRIDADVLLLYGIDTQPLARARAPRARTRQPRLRE